SKKVSGNLTPILESTAAAGGGAVAADRLLAYSPKFNVATFKALTENRDYYWRAKYPNRERLFAGTGSFSLTPEVVAGENRVNMNLLTHQLDN
ncbi:hypothetical protein ABTD16_19375, partial [Acinetobacter baumannii]